MLKEDWKTLAEHRLSTAMENYRAAINLQAADMYRIANNRAYYSMFHSMRAVLALEGKDFKKHSSLLGYFNQQYISTDIFPRELSKRITQASVIRNESDYNDFYIVNKSETQEQVESAKIVYDTVSSYLESRFAEAGEG